MQLRKRGNKRGKTAGQAAKTGNWPAEKPAAKFVNRLQNRPRNPRNWPQKWARKQNQCKFRRALRAPPKNPKTATFGRSRKLAAQVKTAAAELAWSRQGQEKCPKLRNLLHLPTDCGILVQKKSCGRFHDLCGSTDLRAAVFAPSVFRNRLLLPRTGCGAQTVCSFDKLCMICTTAQTVVRFVRDPILSPREKAGS